MSEIDRVIQKTAARGLKGEADAAQDELTRLRRAKQERDTARQEAVRLRDVLRDIMNTPPDNRPTHKGHNERKAWQIIDDMKGIAHEALHSSDAPASEPHFMDPYSEETKIESELMDRPQTDAQREALEAVEGINTILETYVSTQDDAMLAEKLVDDLRHALSQSGQAVPEAVRRLPEQLRDTAHGQKARAAYEAQGDEEKRAYLRGQASGVEYSGKIVEEALATHPADGDSPAVPDEPTELMAQEGFKELPVEGPVMWPHLLNVYRTMVATGRIQKEAEQENAAAPTPDEDGE